MLLFRLLEAAEADHGLAAGFLRRHAAAEVFVDGEVEVRSELGVEFSVKRLLFEEGA